MIRALKFTAMFLVVALAAFFAFAPGIAERMQNSVSEASLPEISEEARALHADLTIVDLHSDTLLWKRDLLVRSGYGHMDLPRLIEGNVTLQVFSSVSQSPAGQNWEGNSAEARDNITLLSIGQLQPYQTWFSPFQRSMYHAEKLDDAVARAPDALRFILSPEDIDAVLEQRDATGRPIGGLYSVEGLHNLEGEPANLQRLYDRGMRMAGLVHFFDNALAGSMHGEEKGGLTPFGSDMVREMERLGIIIDIAHCSEQCVADVLAMARRPVISSHGGVQATCNINRNLSDAQIRGVAETGGVIGVGYFEGAVCGTSPADIVAAMRSITDLVGVEYVALGSDFDGSVEVGFDTSQLVHITQALMDDGFSEEEIRAIMGLNALRVLREGIVPMNASEAEAN